MKRQRELEFEPAPQFVRARVREDCAPRTCPWCGKLVGMRIHGMDSAGLVICCPECGRRVDYYAHKGSPRRWHWACFATGVVQVPDLGLARALNTCRPCPFVSCRHHLYLEVHPVTGAMKLNFRNVTPDQMGDTCALDVAENGGMTLKEVGDVMNLTRERIRQLEVKSAKDLAPISKKMTDG